MKPARLHAIFSLLLAGILATTVGCGGSSNSSSGTSSGGGSNAANNVQTITVNAGPTLCRDPTRLTEKREG